MFVNVRNVIVNANTFIYLHTYCVYNNVYKNVCACATILSRRLLSHQLQLNALFSAALVPDDAAATVLDWLLPCMARTSVAAEVDLSCCANVVAPCYCSICGNCIADSFVVFVFAFVSTSAPVSCHIIMINKASPLLLLLQPGMWWTLAIIIIGVVAMD